jgi:GDP-L-fucose synthase
VNIGTGKDITILELATLIKEETDFKGSLEFDSTKPDGTPRKLLDVSKINGLGWTAKTPLREGIQKTIQWYLENK